MSSELIPLAEAAKKLGISVEKITEMRSNNEIFGYRDGSSWKFKASEIERVAQDLSDGSAPDAIIQNESDDDFALSDSSLSDGQISDQDTPVESAKDEAQASEDDLSFGDSGELSLADSGELSFGESDLSLATKIGDPNALNGKSSAKGDNDELMLVDEDLFDDELSLQDSGGISSGSEMGSDFADSSDVIVADSDSDAPASSSDVILDEEDLVVAGSDGDDDFDLSDDDILSLDGDVDSHDATAAIGGVDDFELSPTGDSFDDQSSSSQIIALDESEILDDSSSAGVLGGSGDLLGGSDELGGAVPMDSFDATGFDEATPNVAMAAAEAPFTIFQLASLGITLCFLSLLLVCSFSLTQNMWQPDDTTYTSTFANWLINLMDFDSTTS